MFREGFIPSLFYIMTSYQYKNILFEYHEFKDCVSIINAELTRPSTNKVFKIPAEINGKPVTSFSRYGRYDYFIKDFTDIIIPSTIKYISNIKSVMPLNIHVDSLDYYFKISDHLCFGRNSKLYINNLLITSLKLNPNIPCIINSLQIDIIDCVDLMNFNGIQFFNCSINRIINTHNIEIIPSYFSSYTNWYNPLHFPNVVIINSEAFALDNTLSITLNCPNLVFIESNIIYDKMTSITLPTIRIQTKTNPIIYPQKYQINVNDCYTSGNH